MKNLILYFIGTVILVIMVLTVQFEETVLNQSKSEAIPDQEMVSIPIPVSLTTPNYSGETYTYTRDIDVNNCSGSIFIEMDENGNFYYVAYSKSLANYFDLIPNKLLFDQFYQGDELHAGEHADCIRKCKKDEKKGEGLGSCKATCWVDTIIELIDAVVPG